MTQTINPEKLKLAAEHLEWVLNQYADSEKIQGLLRALAPFIEDAKNQKVDQPVDSMDIPGAYNFGDGVYTPYKTPSVSSAYSGFITEMRGGLTEQEQRILSRMKAFTEADGHE